MKKIKIDFIDFWVGFDKENNLFTQLLKEDYDVEITDNPEYVFYSVFGSKNKTMEDVVKIFFTGENLPPNFDRCDWSFTFDYLEDERNYRLPLYIFNPEYYNLTKEKIIRPSLAKRRFCNFVVSNGTSKIRNTFFEELNKYKKVDSGGRYKNNIGYFVDNKKNFQTQYKFSIAFENSTYRMNHPGYTTEKILDAMIAVTIPIYWGNPVVDLDFNRESFINAYDFKDMWEMIEYIKYLDNNDDAYLEKLSKPWLVNNEIIEPNKKENIKKFLNKIFT